MLRWLRRLLTGKHDYPHDVTVDYVRDELDELAATLAALGVEVDAHAQHRDRHDQPD